MGMGLPVLQRFVTQARVTCLPKIAPDLYVRLPWTLGLGKCTVFAGWPVMISRCWAAGQSEDTRDWSCVYQQAQMGRATSVILMCGASVMHVLLLPDWHVSCMHCTTKS